MVYQVNYTLLDSHGNVLAGDDALDHHMTARCDEVGGSIIDKAGTTVYPLEG